MKRCPVCRAEYKGPKICHRCKTDLSLPAAAQDRARDCLSLAREALLQNDYKKMRYFALKATALKGSDDANIFLHLYE